MAGRISYYGNIVSNGLIMDLDAAKFDSYPKTGTRWYDITWTTSGGTLINGPVFNSNNGGYFSFDGTNDYADLGNVLFNSATTVTLDIWVNFPSMTGNRYIMAKGSAGDGIYTFYMTTGPGPSGGGSSYIRFSMGNQSGAVSTVIEYGSLVWGQWYNFTFTYNGTTVTGYRNASSPSTSSLSGNLYTTTSSITLASDKYGNISASNIACFKIYNRVLSASEVLQNYNALKGRYGL
jgi:hypothetical protein